MYEDLTARKKQLEMELAILVSACHGADFNGVSEVCMAIRIERNIVALKLDAVVRLIEKEKANG